MTIDSLIKNFSIEVLKDFLREKIYTFKEIEGDYEFLFENNENVVDNFSDILKIGEADLSDSDDLIVITARTFKQLTDKSGKKQQYEIAKKILKEENKDAAFFIFYDEEGNFRFSLITAQYTGTSRKYTTFKRYTYFIDPKAPNKTFRNQIVQADFTSLEKILEAFSIEAVTDTFYKEFEPKFKNLSQGVIGEADFKTKEDFALLFVIRIIFLGFVQKKGWLNRDKNFILTYWKEYKKNYYGDNKFYDDWLNLLFFNALNNPPGRKVFNRSTPFPKELEVALQMAPYLNGELFKEKNGYDNKELSITDKKIEEFFEFLFSYNFTIEENTLYDQELELNPEFLGIIFERIVNKEYGAVYTPRTEVDFMCRLSLVKWLQKNSSVNVKKLYHLFFDADKDSFISLNLNQNEKHEISKLLQSLAVCDPASGSGAFTVGMLQVLFETLSLLTPNSQSEFERKKEIINRSLYGVEVKQWAVWINQLRLWLSLFIEMPDELKNSFEPLLPNLEFKIRRGDSIVQKIGGKYFPIHTHADISQNIKNQINKLKKEKTDFFLSKSKLTSKHIIHSENLIFRSIIDEEIRNKKITLRDFGEDSNGNINLWGEVDTKENLRLQLEKDQKERLLKEIAELQIERDTLKERHPLIWNVEFAEIFSEKKGFDIIIGNPPYVRQEEISDPEGKLSPDEYKKALRQSIYEEYQDYFFTKKDKSKLRKKIDGRSDLYTFFYLKSFKLLNKKGILTFICFNSWLDVGYGKWLQEFILSKVPMHYIIDNDVKRSFASSDVNTIISVFSSPQKSMPEKFKTKFVVFKKPFEEVLNTDNLLILEYAEGITKDEDFRIFPITYAELTEAGSIYEDESKKKLGYGKYIGDKWGGKYLRAPDIYRTIMEKGKDKFVRLGDIAEVRRGFTTGANDFFYVEDLTDKITELDFERIENLKDIQTIEEIKEKKLRVVKPSKYKSGDKDYKLFLIEDEFLKPVIKSPRELKTITVNEKDLKYKVLICNKAKNELTGKYILNYIHWGENVEIEIKQGKDKGKKIVGYNNISTIKARKIWWDLGRRRISEFVVPSKVGERFGVWVNGKYFTDKILYDCYLNDNETIIIIKDILNSTLTRYFIEIFSRQLTGAQAISDIDVIVYKKTLILNPKLISSSILSLNKNIYSIFKELGFKQNIPVSQQEPNPLPDRKELDDIIFDAIGLTEEERKEVYWATAELVQNRLKKAKSV